MWRFSLLSHLQSSDKIRLCMAIFRTFMSSFTLTSSFRLGGNYNTRHNSNLFLALWHLSLSNTSRILIFTGHDYSTFCKTHLISRIRQLSLNRMLEYNCVCCGGVSSCGFFFFFFFFARGNSHKTLFVDLRIFGVGQKVWKVDICTAKNKLGTHLHFLDYTAYFAPMREDSTSPRATSLNLVVNPRVSTGWNIASARYDQYL